MGQGESDHVIRELQDYLLAQGTAYQDLFFHHLGKKHYLIPKGYAQLYERKQSEIQKCVEGGRKEFARPGFPGKGASASGAEAGAFVILILTARAFHISASFLSSEDIFSISLILFSSSWSFTLSRHNSWDTGSGTWV